MNGDVTRLRRPVLKGLILLGLILLVNGLVRLVEPVGLGNSEFQARWQHYRSIAEDIDAVFVGSSQTMRHFNVPRIDSLVQDCGFPEFSSYNLGSSGINLYRNAHITRKLMRLKENRPRWIFLEIAHSMQIADRNVGSSGASFFVDSEILRNVVESAGLPDGSGATAELVTKYARQWLYRLLHAGYGRASALWKYEFARSRGFTGTDAHLFRPWVMDNRKEHLASRESFQNALRKFDNDFYQQLSSADQPVVDAFVKVHVDVEEEARRRGVQLIHVQNIRPSNDPRSFAVYDALPGDNKIRLHRYDRMPFLRTFEAWWDATHLGAEGADTLSQYFAKQLCQSGLLLPE